MPIHEEINVFIIYAREDREIKQGLLRHLNPLKEPYNLNLWHDDHIDPGQEWKPSIESRLEKTDLFLLLVSADFMNSEFIHQVEFKFAIDRHKQNKSIVIPVIIDWCLWDIDINFQDYVFNLNQLQVLPDSAKPIGEWKTPEQAYNNIATGIRRVLTSIQKQRREIAVAEEKKTTVVPLENPLPSKEPTIEIRERQEIPGKPEETSRAEVIEEDTYSITNQDETSQNKSFSKRIILSLLIIGFLIVAGYFAFRKTNNTDTNNPKEKDTSTLITYDNYQSHSNETPPVTSNVRGDSMKPANPTVTSLTDKTKSTKVPLNSFNSFSNALLAVFRDAPNNF